MLIILASVMPPSSSMAWDLTVCPSRSTVTLSAMDSTSSSLCEM